MFRRLRTNLIKPVSKTLIIAEVGVNHNGDLKIARELVSIAASAGADIVKFQTFTASKLLTEDAPKAAYQIDSASPDNSNYEMLQSLELSHDDHLTLIEDCKKNHIEFLSTAFDIESLIFLLDLGMKRIKIPSGEITNKPFLEFISQFNIPVIMSTGMADIQEIAQALAVLRGNKLKPHNITILQCTSQYPAKIDDINLRVMQSLRDQFKLQVGYSDHTLGLEAPIAAAALGASIIEKHITLDVTMPGPDHKASMEPENFLAMVSAIRKIEQSLGNGIKTPTKDELEMRTVARKSLVAKTNINEGDLLTLDNLAIKRPGNGISPMDIDSVIGKQAPCSFKINDLIKI